MTLLSERLKELRRKHNLSQEEMSRIMETSQRAYSYYEHGERHPRNSDVLLKVAERFNVSVDWLIGNEKGEVFLIESKASYRPRESDEQPTFVREFSDSDEGQKMIALICASGLTYDDLKRAILLLEQEK